MSKKSLLMMLLLAILAPWAAQAQETVTIGDGTTTQNQVPIGTYYNYSITEQLYTADEIGMAGTISSIRFYYAGTAAKDFPVEVYMQNVDAADLSTGISLADAELVFNGIYSVTETGGWTTITLDTPFEYDGASNLLIGINKGYVYYYSGGYWQGTAIGNMARYTQNDSSPYTTSTTPGNIQANRPNIQLDIIPAGGVICPRPTNLTTALAGSTVTATWEGEASLYNIDVNGTVTEGVTSPYTFAVEPATSYTVKVQADCGDGLTSGWVSAPSFMTPCEAFALPYAYGFEDAAEFSCWDVVGSTSSSTGIATVSDAPEGSMVFRFYYTESNAYLLSPVLDGTENGVMVSFQYMNSSSTTSWVEQFQVGYTTDEIAAAADFVYGETINGQNEWVTYENVFPANTKRIAIKYIYTDAMYLRLDDFNFEAPGSCLKPSGLAYSEVTAHSVRLSWNENGEAIAWQICLNNDEDDLIVVMANDLTEGAYTLTGLDAETAYTAKVRANCGEGDYSDWSSAVSFTTTVACPAPTGLTTTVTAHSATLNWNGTSESYTVKYRLPEHDENGVNEQFGTAIPTGWTMYDGLLSTVMNGGALTSASYGWSFGTSNGVFDNHARTNVYGNFQKWLVTPSFDLTSSTFTFDLALTAYSGTEVPAPATNGTDDKFVVLISTDNKATWTILRQWDNEEGSTYVYNNIANTAMGEQVSIDLSSYVGQTVCIAFYGESTVSNADNNVHIDNVVIGNPVHIVPEWTTVTTTETTVTLSGLAANTQYEVELNGDCGDEGLSTVVTRTITTLAGNLPPTGLQLVAGSLSAYQATVSWTGNAANDLHESFDFYYSTESTMPEELDEANLITGLTETSYTLTDLEPETQYYVWVRDNCGTDGISAWSSRYTFVTLDACPIPTNFAANNLTATTADLSWTGSPDVEMYTVRYRTAATVNALFSEDFENAASLDNWTFTSMNTANNIESGYAGRNTNAAHSGSYGFRFSSYSSATDYNQYLISPELNVSGELRFYFRKYNSSDEELYVGVSTTTSDLDAFTWSENLAPTQSWQEYSQTLPDDVKYIAFHYYGDYQYYVYVDDITIGEPVPAGEWIAFTTDETSLHATDLTPETQYEAQVMSQCSEDEWSDAIYFTTTAIPAFTLNITGYGDATNPGGYYLIASPVAEVQNPTQIAGMTDGEYDLYFFDQEQSGAEWQNYESTNFMLENGKGYLYAHDTDVTLSFVGVPVGDQIKQLELVYNGECNLPGWNLIGNPFGQDCYINRPFYVMNEDGSDLISLNAYESVEAMQGFFVVAENEGEFVTLSTIPQNRKAVGLVANLSQEGNVIDRAIVNFNNVGSLPKFQLNPNNTKVYIPMEGKDYAIVSAETMGETPMNFKADENGSYTLSFTTEEVSFNYLHLIDNMTGTDVDLIATPYYSFEAKTTDYASRFKLVYATGANSDDNFAFMSNGSFIISNEGEATLQVVDVTGRVLSSETISGSCSKTVNAAPGVYMLRLINGDNMKVQKVVVK